MRRYKGRLDAHWHGMGYAAGRLENLIGAKGISRRKTAVVVVHHKTMN